MPKISEFPYGYTVNRAPIRVLQDAPMLMVVKTSFDNVDEAGDLRLSYSGYSGYSNPSRPRSFGLVLQDCLSSIGRDENPALSRLLTHFDIIDDCAHIVIAGIVI
ncbi:MAG: hypothetical protein JSR71_00760 [Proteobacteria bacterium]|nr:hypothetical protein [Pseudomonadota bacterium]